MEQSIQILEIGNFELETVGTKIIRVVKKERM